MQCARRKQTNKQTNKQTSKQANKQANKPRLKGPSADVSHTVAVGVPIKGRLSTLMRQGYLSVPVSDA